MAAENYRKVRIAENLRCYQELHKYSLAEFAEKLGVPKSTLQSVMQDGNTTLDTLVKIQQGMNTSLDELVYGEMAEAMSNGLHELLKGISRYAEMETEHQDRVRYYLLELLEIMKHEKT